MATSQVKVKAAKIPKAPTVKAPKPIKITPPIKASQAEKQVAAFEKQYLTQQKELAQQYKALGLHSVAERAGAGQGTPTFKSQGAPYHRQP